MYKPQLSIIIPALAEEKRIGKTLQSLSEYLTEKKHADYEVIVVAAEGGDQTASEALKFSNKFKQLKLVEPGPKVGKGRDVKAGMLEATGSKRIYMDADLATPLHHIEETIRLLEKYDIVAGARNLETIHSGVRRYISEGWNFAARLFLGVRIRDTQCGFKGFTEQASDITFGRLTIMGWLFDMEILCIARVHKLSIATIPVDDWKDVPGGTFGGSIIRDSIRTLKEFIAIFFKKITGVYK